MTKIKICGLSRKKDITAVNQYLPDFAGFVFARSKRQVTMGQAEELISLLSPKICPVGIFVNEDPVRVVEIARHCRLKVIQLHGEEDCITARRIKGQSGCKIWRAVRVKDQQSLHHISYDSADRFLFDTYSAHGHGGVGKTFDWSLLQNMPKQQIILAGGLNLQNIIPAVRQIRPWAVDISSGVETDGKKDPEKIKEIICTLREQEGARKEVWDEKR